MYKKIYLLNFLTLTYSIYPLELKPHEIWWNTIGAHDTHYALLYGDISAPSRIAARCYLKTCNYITMLDIPCGFCTEYFGLMQDAIPITYYGIDIAEQLVQHGIYQGLMVSRGSIEQIPMADASVDICYARHIFEHIPSYQTALTELIRVARKEVLIIFSLIPSHNPDTISLRKGVYFNQYNKKNLEQFCKENKKVTHLVWQRINGREIMLHIYLKG